MFLLTRTIDGKPMLLNLTRTDAIVADGGQLVAVTESGELMIEHNFHELLNRLAPLIVNRVAVTPPDKSN